MNLNERTYQGKNNSIKLIKRINNEIKKYTNVNQKYKSVNFTKIDPKMLKMLLSTYICIMKIIDFNNST